MKILEFGNKNNKKILLIHGFQSPYQIWNKYIEHYEKDFHVIVPILPGHDPELDEDFVSFSLVAKELEEYYISRYGTDLYAIYGMSMGGVLAATIWQNGNLNIEKIILDGSPLVSYNKLIKKAMTTFYLNITAKTKARDSKTIEQAKTSIVTEETLDSFLMLMDKISDNTIVNYIENIGNYKLPSNITTPNTKVYFFHGTKSNETFAKKTAKHISKHYPKSVIKRFKGKGHCEISLLHPEKMIKELDNIL